MSQPTHGFVARKFGRSLEFFRLLHPSFAVFIFLVPLISPSKSGVQRRHVLPGWEPEFRAVRQRVAQNPLGNFCFVDARFRALPRYSTCYRHRLPCYRYESVKGRSSGYSPDWLEPCAAALSFRTIHRPWLSIGLARWTINVRSQVVESSQPFQEV